MFLMSEFLGIFIVSSINSPLKPYRLGKRVRFSGIMKRGVQLLNALSDASFEPPQNDFQMQNIQNVMV